MSDLVELKADRKRMEMTLRDNVNRREWGRVKALAELLITIDHKIKQLAGGK